jgi:hypothetical protein
VQPCTAVYLPLIRPSRRPGGQLSVIYQSAIINTSIYKVKWYFWKITNYYRRSQHHQGYAADERLPPREPLKPPSYQGCQGVRW